MRRPRPNPLASDPGMRAHLAILWLPVAGFFGFIAWYHWDTSRNRGSESGYYGEFNRVAHALSSIPEVTVARSWHNADLTLEEFGFDLTVSGQPLKLHFSETDHIRSMSREAATAALRSRIASELPTAR
jgi:hypothetical protein